MPRPRPGRAMRLPALTLAALALLPLAAVAEVLPQPACEVPGDVMPGSVRVDGGPTQAVRIRFTLAQPTTGEVGVWFALRGSAAEPGWPAERALAAGFLEDASGAPVAIVSPQLGIYPYGVVADVAAVGLRVAATDGDCLGAFGAVSTLDLAAGSYDLVVVGASEAGSRFAALLPPEAQVAGVTTGPATLLSAGTLACEAKVRAHVSGLLAEVLRDCATPLPAAGRAYRSLVATWGPSADHDVAWRDPGGALVRCYKAPRWCVDTGSGPAGPWTLEVPRYTTLQQPTLVLPSLGSDYSGLFGVFAGRP